MAKAIGAKRQLIQEIEGLSEDRVRALADLAAFMREREEWVATLEVLNNKELAKAIRNSREAWSQGKHSEFVSLDELEHSHQ